MRRLENPAHPLGHSFSRVFLYYSARGNHAGEDS
jgi:hypothetical protein